MIKDHGKLRHQVTRIILYTVFRAKTQASLTKKVCPQLLPIR